MNRAENNLLTPNQFTMMMLFSAVTIGILSIPNEVVENARQDGWISALLGGIYPFYVVIGSLYIAGNYSKENILILNKKFFGKFMGTILNMLQLFIYVFYVVSEVSGISNFLRVYVVDFLSSFRAMYIYIALAAFCAYKGLKAIGRISEIIFINLLLTAAVGIFSLAKGSFLNIMPVLGSGWINIIKGIKGTMYAYGGIEVVLLLYPYINDKNKFKASIIKSAALICMAYTWVSFITIFYMGHRIIPKALWSSLFITESLRLPIINNYRFIVMFLWIFVSITGVALDYYACELVVRDIFKNLKRNIFYFLSVPVMLYISMLLKEEVQRREIIRAVMFYVGIFNILYILLMVLTVYFKKEKAYG